MHTYSRNVRKLSLKTRKIAINLQRAIHLHLQFLSPALVLITVFYKICGSTKPIPELFLFISDVQISFAFLEAGGFC